MGIFQKLFALLLAVTVLASLASASLFVADQREYTMVYRSGQLVRMVQAPGVQAKWPLPLQEVRTLDRRTLVSTGNTGDQPIAAGEGPRVLLSWYVQWRITDPLHYLEQVGDTSDVGSVRLNAALRAALQDDLGNVPLTQWLADMSGMSRMLKARLNTAAQQSGKPWGLEVLDVRMTRIDVDQQTAEAAHARMHETLQQIAGAFKGEAASAATVARAETDAKRDALLAEGRRQAQQIRGEGDAEAIRIYAQDYAKDPRFASFFRSLAVYRKSFDKKNDVLVIDPADNPFFPHLREGGGALPSVPAAGR